MKMGEQILSESLGDPPADDVDAAAAIGEQIGDAVKFAIIEELERGAEVIEHRGGKAVEHMCFGRFRRPAVVFRDRRLKLG